MPDQFFKVATCFLIQSVRSVIAQGHPCLHSIISLSPRGIEMLTLFFSFQGNSNFLNTFNLQLTFMSLKVLEMFFFCHVWKFYSAPTVCTPPINVACHSTWKIVVGSSDQFSLKLCTVTDRSFDVPKVVCIALKSFF